MTLAADGPVRRACVFCDARDRKIEQELRDAEAAFRAASVRADELREARNRIVRVAMADGWTHARIARATGLTRGRVGQIAMQERNA